MTQSPKGNYATADAHQAHEMARNPAPNTSTAKPSAAASTDLSGLKRSAESKVPGTSTAGGLRVPGSMGVPADPTDAGGSGD